MCSSLHHGAASKRKDWGGPKNGVHFSALGYSVLRDDSLTKPEFLTEHTKHEVWYSLSHGHGSSAPGNPFDGLELDSPDNSSWASLPEFIKVTGKKVLTPWEMFVFDAMTTPTYKARFVFLNGCKSADPTSAVPLQFKGAFGKANAVTYLGWPSLALGAAPQGNAQAFAEYFFTKASEADVFDAAEYAHARAGGATGVIPQPVILGASHISLRRQ